MEKQKIVIEGFAFTNKKAALKAQHEAESISYLRSQIHMENPRMVQGFYQKLLAEEVFETPVGLMFLKELYDGLASMPELQETLSPIPTEKMAEFLSEGGDNQNLSPLHSGPVSDAPVQPQAEREAEPGASPKGEKPRDFQQAEEMASFYEDKLTQAKQKVRSAEQKQRRAEEAMRKKKSSLRISMAVNFFLLLVAVGMIIIALMDDNPNIINYENQILDKYSQWEMELEDREAQIKEKEKELNIR